MKHIPIFCSLFAISATAFAAQGANQMPHNSFEEGRDFHARTDKFATDHDEEILSQARKILSNKRISQNGDSLDISVDQGTITMRGTASNGEEVRQIADRLRKIPGVRAVKMELKTEEIKTPADNGQFQNPQASRQLRRHRQIALNEEQKNGVTVQDRKLWEKAKHALTNSWSSKNFSDVDIHVNNGNVTLTGEVADRDEIREIEKRIRDIKGVKSLDNQIDVGQYPKMD